MTAGGQVARRRRRLVTAITVGSVLMIGSTLAVSHFVVSPAQVAAQAAPPPVTPLVATVTRQAVSDTLVLRAHVVDHGEYQVTPEGAQGAQSLIVTAIDKGAGSEVNPGDVVAEISGRPLFVLPGATPAYRDLTPGAQGKDVAQLQRALASLGYPSAPDRAGWFGPGTQHAVARFYAHIGYAPALAGDPAQLQADRQAATQAARNLTALQDSASSSGASASGASTSGASTPANPAASTATAAGGGSVPLSTQIAWAQQDLANAQATLASQEATTGIKVPMSEVSFLPSFPAHIVTIAGSVGQPPPSPFLTIASGDPLLAAQLDPAERGLIRVGMDVTITDTVEGISSGGTVDSIAATATTTGSDSGVAYLPVTISPEPALPYSEIGQDVEVTVTTARTAALVLAVPVSSIFSQADGSTYVSVVDRDGDHKVAVRTGLSGDGLVSVTPVDPSSLAPGMKVDVGLASTSPAAGPGSAVGTG